MKNFVREFTIYVFLLLFPGGAVFAESGHQHNLSNNTVGSFLGMSNLEYSQKISDRLTVGITGSTGKIDVGVIRVKGNSYGFVSRYYIDTAFKNDSWYLLISVTQNNYKGLVESNGVSYEGKIDGTVLGCGGGYHFFWNTFNLNLGLFLKNGEVIRLSDNAGNPYKDNFDNRIGAEFNIGWKF